MKPDASIIDEIEEQRPRYPVGLLSRQEKDLLIERGMVGLYRWYLTRSQVKRNWDPTTSFDWRALRTDHSPLLNDVIEGFYAVEQYVPDYTSKGIHAVRSSYGRSQFQIRWGAEEEKHADLWLNTMLFLRHRSPDWIREYGRALRNNEYDLRWDDIIHTHCYVVFQERATQVSYLNTALVAQGKSTKSELANDTDPVLAQVAKTIAIDEAAHYHFFLEVARLYLYYYPAETLQAILDNVVHFHMPALDLIKLMPDMTSFEETTYRAGVYTHRHHVVDIVKVALDNLGHIVNRRSLVNGLKRSRQVPDADGNVRDTALFDVFDYDSVEEAVQKVFGRIEKVEQEMGLDEIDPTHFVPSGMGKKAMMAMAN